MGCCNEIRSVWGGAGAGAGAAAGAAAGAGAGAGAGAAGAGGGLITNILNAAGTLSQLRLQMIYDNVKPLQQALGNRRSGPLIVGGLATGVLIYCGHRWLNATSWKRKDRKGSWKLKLKDDGEDVMLGLETGHFEALGPKEINVEPPLGLLEFEEVE